MKKALSLLVAALLVMGWSDVSKAASNYYASGNIGLVWFDDVEFHPTALDDQEEDDDYIKTLFDSGITLTGAIGCDLGDVRGELEMGYQVNDAKEALELNYIDDKPDPGPFPDDDDSKEITGEVSLVTFMFNGYYDIPITDSGLELFLTAGVGSAFWHFDEIGDADDPDAGEERSNNNGSTWAYQIGAGLSLPVGDNIMLEARYRYFNTAEFTVSDDDDFLDDIDNDDPFYADIASHSALVGLRYNF